MTNLILSSDGAASGLLRSFVSWLPKLSPKTAFQSASFSSLVYSRCDQFLVSFRGLALATYHFSAAASGCIAQITVALPECVLLLVSVQSRQYDRDVSQRGTETGHSYENDDTELLLKPDRRV